MTDVRCPKCRRLLMKAEHVHAEVKCPKCGYVVSARVSAETVRTHEPVGGSYLNAAIGVPYIT